MFLIALPMLLLSARSAYADCECGYAIDDSTIFTEAVETDFLHLEDLAPDANHTWIPQAYNVTRTAARGPFGKSSQVENVVPNPVHGGQFDWLGPGIRAEDPGLQLWVRSTLLPSSSSSSSSSSSPEDGEMVPMAEIVSSRDDVLYGSFRIGMKTTSVPGTCAAFFFYFNDSNEIDMEFLSKQNVNRTINLVIQSPESASRGYASGSDFDTRTLAFGSQEGYNEYRFDWRPGRVDFYANSVLLSSISDNVPQSAGKIHVSHWSNGNEGWSAGPPNEDAVVTVSYVKAYFNSSDAGVTTKSLKSCTEAASQQLCRVPDQTAPPDPGGFNGNETGHTTFFTLPGSNATIGDDDGPPQKGDGSRCVFPEAWWTASIFFGIVLLFT